MPCQLGDSVVPTRPHKKPAHRKSQLPRSGRPSDRNANTLPANASEPKSAPAPLPFVCQLWAPPEDPSYRSRFLVHRLSSASGLEVPYSDSDPKKTQSSSDQKGGEGEKKMEPFPEPRHWYEVVGTLASERSCCHWCTLPAFTSLGLPQRNSFDSFVTGVQRGKFRKIGPHHYPLAGRTKWPEFRMYTGRTLVQRLGSKLNGSWPRVSQSKDSMQNVFKKNVCPVRQSCGISDTKIQRVPESP